MSPALAVVGADCYGQVSGDCRSEGTGRRLSATNGLLLG